MTGWTARLEAFIAERLPSADSVEVLHVFGMPAGASNETVGLDVRITCDVHTFELPLVLRPQRERGILAPYDVGRQFRVMRALSATDVPVPPVLWHEPGDDVLGVPFYFMLRVPGETLPLFWYGGASPRLYAIAEALAAVHAVDWRRLQLDRVLGLTVLPASVATEIAGWDHRLHRLGLANQELVAKLRRFLLANEPADARVAFLHGDPNPGNYLMRGDRVGAVLDWELASLGDPRSDLGFYAALCTVFGGMPAHEGRTVLSDAYASVTGQRLTALDYYEALGLFRMAVVTAGWGGFSRFGHGTELIERRLAALFGPRWAA